MIRSSRLSDVEKDILSTLAATQIMGPASAQGRTANQLAALNQPYREDTVKACLTVLATHNLVYEFPGNPPIYKITIPGLRRVLREALR